jgi:hypothetical protein
MYNPNRNDRHYFQKNRKEKKWNQYIAQVEIQVDKMNKGMNMQYVSDAGRYEYPCDRCNEMPAMNWNEAYGAVCKSCR